MDVHDFVQNRDSFGLWALKRVAAYDGSVTAAVSDRLGLIKHALILEHQLLILIELGLEITRVHHGEHLAGFHHVALIDVELRDPARELGVDIDLVGFEPTVPEGDACWQGRPRVQPPGL